MNGWCGCELTATEHGENRVRVACPVTEDIAITKIETIYTVADMLCKECLEFKYKMGMPRPEPEPEPVKPPARKPIIPESIWREEK